MLIKFKTKCNQNGNSYGLIVDTEKGQYTKGFGIVKAADFTVKKSDIDGFVKYNLADFQSVDIQTLNTIKLY